MEETVEEENYFSTNEAEEPTETNEPEESDTEFWQEIENIVNITAESISRASPRKWT